MEIVILYLIIAAALYLYSTRSSARKRNEKHIKELEKCGVNVNTLMIILCLTWIISIPTGLFMWLCGIIIRGK